jgi:hypothetical protein
LTRRELFPIQELAMASKLVNDADQWIIISSTYRDTLRHRYNRDFSLVVFESAMLLEDIIATQSDRGRLLAIHATYLMEMTRSVNLLSEYSPGVLITYI